MEEPNSPGVNRRFSDLGERLKRVFTFQNGSTKIPHATEIPMHSELSHAVFFAKGVQKKFDRMADYRNSAGRTRHELESSAIQLKQAINDILALPGLGSDPASQREVDQALSILCLINIALGQYNKTETTYNLILESLEFHLQSQPLKLAKHELKTVISYINFVADNSRMHCFDKAKVLGEHFLTRKNELSTSREHCRLWLSLSNLYNTCKDFQTARDCLETVLDSGLHDTFGAYYVVTHSLQRAITSTGLQEKVLATQRYIAALVQSAMAFGIWHHTTLSVFYHYGSALKTWGNDSAAVCVLAECCMGRLYRYGATHPITKAAIAELESCGGSKSASDRIREFGSYSEEEKQSIAYEHIFLNTVIDLLDDAGELGWVEIEEILRKPLRVETTEHRAIYTIRLCQSLMRCKWVDGRRGEAIQDATDMLDGVTLGVKRNPEGELQSMLDLAALLVEDADPKNKTKLSGLSRIIFFDENVKLSQHQASAFRRRLDALGLTHFSYDTIATKPLPVQVVDTVGTGAYAIVESVKVSGQMYARKSIALPRYNQKRLRQTIQNEISAIRTLRHPHIVKIHCTYEEKSRFSIVLDPLADCDLEAYLCEDDADHKLLWKWMYCLSNSLDFIHSKGIRHKDIKTRNILVKNSEVLFADFGSSHAFLDEGTSTTEGPAFGHTLMYCAPEVMLWQKRSRSADIFSLGCVFSEIATVLSNRKISDYYDFRTIEVAGRETHAYHATLGLVNDWFNNVEMSDITMLYVYVVHPMIEKNPEDRITASVATNEAKGLFEENCPMEMICSKCGDSDRSSRPR